MATYLNKEFGASDYAKFRPSYPEKLYEFIKEYHDKNGNGKPIKLAVDLACGTGQATQDVAKLSERVVGLDHSEVMVNEARKQFPSNRFEFKVGSDLDFDQLIEPETTDLLTVAEAAHWFHYPEFWQKAYNVLAPGGTLAIFSYWTFTFPDYPCVKDIINDYASSSDKCGPYFDSGRDLLNDEYIYLRETIPNSLFKAIEYRVNDYATFSDSEPFEMVKKDVKVGAMIALLKTWSPYFNWKRNNPGAPDIADGVMDSIHEKTGLTPDDTVSVKWKTVLLFATKK